MQLLYIELYPEVSTDAQEFYTVFGLLESVSLVW